MAMAHRMKRIFPPLWRASLVALLFATACAAPVYFQPQDTAAPAAPAGEPEAEPRSFTVFYEFHGPNAYQDPVVPQNLTDGMMNGLTFWPPVQSGMTSFGQPLMLRMPAATGAAGLPEYAIESNRRSLDRLASGSGGAFFWDLLPEWDQSGGDWVPEGRPHYSGITRSSAQQRFLAFYTTAYPRLMEYLRQPATERGYRLVAVTDQAPNVHYAYDWGVELQLLERGIDELGDLATGIAFLRGAARQHDRPWGIDLSFWRTGNDSATTYDASGKLLGGWSASYIRRHAYVSYLAGADALHNEPAVYRDAGGNLNPLGTALLEFGDFALRRHPDLGRPVVPVALLVNPDTGFDPKHGFYQQNNAVWYQDIPYTAADFHLDNLLRTAYPNHWLHGLTPGAGFADSQGVPDSAGFRDYLARGGDPRRFEPMPTTRWGDSLDIVTNQISAPALEQYKVIVLAGEAQLGSQLRRDLEAWVRGGGTLVMFAGQSAAADETLTGVSIMAGESKTGNASQWISNGTMQSEAPFRYVPVSALDAEVVAVTNAGDALVTRHRLGNGEVFFLTAAFGQTESRTALVQATVALLDTLFAQCSPVRVLGGPIQYVIDQDADKVVVGLINNSGQEWNGTISFDRPAGSVSVKEYMADQAVDFADEPTSIGVTASVPAYDIRILALETVSATAP